MIRRLHLQHIALALALLMAGTAGAVAPGTQAPDFALASDGQGNLRLLEQRGRVVMINFWASWCGPCRREMPQLDRLYSKYRDAGFVLWGISVDEEPARAREVLGRLGLHFPVLFDERRQVIRQYDLATMPSTVIVDRDGQVRFVHPGYEEGVEVSYDREVGELLRK